MLSLIGTAKIPTFFIFTKHYTFFGVKFFIFWRFCITFAPNSTIYRSVALEFFAYLAKQSA